jgi:hydrogenase maturation protease
MASLHDLKLIDLFDAAALMDYKAEGLCFGMQVLNSEPAEITIGLTPPVYEALPLLVDAVLAALVRRRVEITNVLTGEVVKEGYHHSYVE